MSFRIAVLTGLLLISCKQEKVSCDTFTKRVRTCGATFGDRLSPNKPWDASRLQTLLEIKLLKACEGRGGKVGDAGKINRCLGKKGCDAFVHCILGPQGGSK